MPLRAYHALCRAFPPLPFACWCAFGGDGPAVASVACVPVVTILTSQPDAAWRAPLLRLVFGVLSALVRIKSGAPLLACRRRVHVAHGGLAGEAPPPLADQCYLFRPCSVRRPAPKPERAGPLEVGRPMSLSAAMLDGYHSTLACPRNR